MSAHRALGKGRIRLSDLTAASGAEVISAPEVGLEASASAPRSDTALTLMGLDFAVVRELFWVEPLEVVARASSPRLFVLVKALDGGVGHDE